MLITELFISKLIKAKVGYGFRSKSIIRQALNVTGSAVANHVPITVLYVFIKNKGAQFIKEIPIEQ